MVEYVVELLRRTNERELVLGMAAGGDGSGVRVMDKSSWRGQWPLS